MEGWSLVFMLVVLKIPMIGALFIIWYAIKEEPAPDEEEADGGRRGPRHNGPQRPRPPRRPAGGVGCRPSPPSPCPQLVHHRLDRTKRLISRRQLPE
jgi:hypothetical protein